MFLKYASLKEGGKSLELAGLIIAVITITTGVTITIMIMMTIMVVNLAVPTFAPRRCPPFCTTT